MLDKKRRAQIAAAVERAQAGDVAHLTLTVADVAALLAECEPAKPAPKTSAK